MKIKALVVDDEPLAQEVLKTYIKEIATIDVIAYCSDALESITFLKEQKIDLIFLDINMPKISGMEFIKTLKNPPLIILTTAYTQYALEGYELNVLDYLAKPFSIQRFLKAIQKVEEMLLLQQKKEERNSESLFIKSNKKTFQIQINEITYIEGLGDYIKIFTEKTHLISNLSMRKIHEQLPSSEFIRIHKSFIINIKKIKSIEGNMVDVGNGKLTIGNHFRQEFFEKISQMGI